MATNPISYTKAGPGECVVEVGHRTRADRVGTWIDDATGMIVCDRHKHTYETAYDDYSHLKWRPLGDGERHDD